MVVNTCWKAFRDLRAKRLERRNFKHINGTFPSLVSRYIRTGGGAINSPVAFWRVGIGPGFLPLSMGITGTTLFASDWPLPGQPWLRICWLRPFPTRFPGKAVLRVMGVMGNCRELWGNFRSLWGDGFNSHFAMATWIFGGDGCWWIYCKMCKFILSELKRMWWAIRNSRNSDASCDARVWADFVFVGVIQWNLCLVTLSLWLLQK